MQVYSDPTREDDPHALPNVEVFYQSADEFRFAERGTWQADRLRDHDGFIEELAGWYYWFCLPGCLPDSEAVGPFGSEDEALEDAQSD